MDSSPSGAPSETPAEPQKPQGRTNGIRALPDRADRPSPYGVFWRVDGAAKKQFFKTAKARDDKLADLARAAKRGTLALVPTRDELKDWVAFRQATAPTPWVDVVAGWKAHLAAGNMVPTRTVTAGVAEFITDLDERVVLKTISKGHADHKRTHLKLFSVAFGGRKMADVTGKVATQWIREDLGFDRAATFNSYVRSLVSLYEFYHKDFPRNPMSEVRLLPDAVEVVGILTVAETAKLFAYAMAKPKYQPALSRLALEAFAGVRFSSAVRITQGEINLADRGVLLQKLKTGGYRYVDGYPENLWAWLEYAGDSGWDLTNNQYMHLKSSLFAAANVVHPHNCLRHTMPTHHVAAYKNPGLTATILVHKNQEKLWSTYNGIATTEAGKAYQAITPLTAAAMSVDPAVLALKYPQLPER